MTAENCPNSDALEAFVLGTIEDLDDVAHHVESCRKCEETVRSLETTGDLVIAKLRQPPPQDEYSDESACRRAVDAVRELGKTAAPQDIETPGAASERETPTAIKRLGQYRLLEQLGEGGMGTVYKALHTKLNRVVALKLLPTERLQDSDAVARFEREMTAVGKLDHPHIVRATDAGEIDGMHYLVMELVEGQDLSSLVKRQGPLPVADACEIIREAAEGLAYAHSHGLVHRDVKPSNVMLTQVESRESRVESREFGSLTPVVKILDLGLALLDDQPAGEGGELTTTGQIMGTLDYMAPEQGHDTHSVDVRADIYSLGATLYKLLTGEAPFAGERYKSIMQKLSALANEEVSDVRAARPDVPAELAAVVHRMLAKLPEDRYATASEVAASLAQFCGGSNLGPLVGQLSEASQSSDGVTETFLTQEAEWETSETRVVTDAARQDLGAARPAKSVSTPGRPRRQLSSLAKTGLVLGVVLAACGVYFAAQVLFFQTEHGTLVVTIHDPDVEVSVKGTKFTITGTGQDSVELEPGDKVLKVAVNGVNFETGTFSLKKGETVAVEVRLLPGEVQVVQNGQLLKRHALEPSTVADDGERQFALQFTGPDNYVQLGDMHSDALHEATLEAIVTPAGDEEQEAPIISWRDGALRAVKNEWLLRLYGTTEHPEVRLTARFVEPGKPTHLAGVLQNGVFMFFVNGKLEAQAKHAGGLTLRNVELGGQHEYPIWFPGTMSQARFSRVARYTENFTPADFFARDDDTLALYRFTEGKGDVLADASGNNRHGKILNARWIAHECNVARSDLRPLAGHTDKIHGLQFLPGGRYLISAGDDQSMRCWDVENGITVWIDNKPPITRFHGFGVSRDGSLIAGGKGTQVQIFDSATGKIQKKIPVGPEVCMIGFAFSPDDATLVAGGTDGHLATITVQNGEIIEHEQFADFPQPNLISSITFLPDGRRYVIAPRSKGGKVYLRELGRKEPLRQFAALTPQDNPTDVAVIDEGRKLVVVGFGSESVYDLETGEELQRAEIGEGGALRLAILSDGRHAVAGSWGKGAGRTLFGIDLHTLEVVGRIDLDSVASHYVAVSEELGVVAHTGSDADYEILFKPLSALIPSFGSQQPDVEKPVRIRELAGHTDHVLQMQFLPDGRHLISSSEDLTLRCWDLETRKNIWTDANAPDTTFYGFAISPDGSLIAGGKGANVQFLDSRTGEILHKIRAARGAYMRGFAFSPDGSTLVAGGSTGNLAVIDVQQAEIVEEYQFPNIADMIPSVAFLPDGRRYVICPFEKGGKVYLRELGREQPLREFAWTSRYHPTDLAVIDEGRKLVIVGFGPSLIYDLETGERLQRSEFTNAGQRLAVLNDGRHAIAGTWGEGAGKTLYGLDLHTLEVVGQVDFDVVASHWVTVSEQLGIVAHTGSGADNKILFTPLSALIPSDRSPRPPVPHLAKSPDREAAEWALAQNKSGRIKAWVDGMNPIFRSVDELPANKEFRVTEIRTSLSGRCDAGQLSMLPRLKYLKELNANGGSFTDEALELLAGLPHLQVVQLDKTALTNSDLETLSKSKSLHHLALSGSGRITDDGLRHVGTMTCLRHLNLNGVSVTDAGLKHLATLKNLRLLSLLSTYVTAEGVAEVRKLLPECRIKHPSVIDDPNDDLDRQVARAFLDLPAPPVEFWIGGLADQGYAELRAGDTLPADCVFGIMHVNLNPAHRLPHDELVNLMKLPFVSQLNFSRATNLDATDFQRLAEMPTLERLWLRMSQLEDADLELISRSQTIISLQASYNVGITAEGLRHIGRMPQLEILDLRSTLITDEGLKHLSSLERLFWLGITDTDVTAAGVAALQAALPDCQIACDFSPEEIARHMAELPRSSDAKELVELVHKLQGHTAVIEGLRTLPGGRQCISTGRDGTLRLWDIERGQELGNLSHPVKKTYWSLAVSQDGKLAATGTVSHAILLWDLDKRKFREMFYDPDNTSFGGLLFCSDDK